MSQPHQKTRLLIVHAQANNHDCGGSFQMLRHLLAGLDHERFDVHCALSLLDKSAGNPDEGAWRTLTELGAQVRVLYVPVNQAGAGPVALLRYGFEVIGATLRLRKLVRRGKFDMVYTNTINMLPSGLAARLTGTKSVYHIHEIVRQPPAVAKILARMVGKLADKLLCVSRAAMAPFEEVGVPERKLAHVPNCIDLQVFDERFDGSAVRNEFLQNRDDRLIVAVGRLVPKKGFHELVEAAKDVVAEMPQARFLLVGDTKSDDSYRQQLLRRIDELGLRDYIIFAGPRTDIPEIMAAADAAVLVAASTATPESFGLVILEALAMGTPVVATALGGIPEVLQDGEHGYLVPPNDPPALAQALLRLLQNPQRARAMGQSGKRWARQNFSGEDYAARVVEVL